MKTDTNTDLTTSNWESKPMSRAFSLRKRRLMTYSSERTRMIGDESTVRYMKNMVVATTPIKHFMTKEDETGVKFSEMTYSCTTSPINLLSDV